MLIDLTELLRRPEGDSLDFKQSDYDLSDTRGKCSLLKDVLSLANTPREGSAYLILGVRWTAESGAQVVGINHHCDESEFRGVLRPDLINPIPRVIYHSLQDQGKPIGVLEIPVDRTGPFTLLKDMGEGTALRGGTIYVREGSTNVEAVGARLQQVLQWFSEGQGPTPGDQHEGAWQRFLDSADGLRTGRRYLLITDPIRDVDSGTLSALGLVPWLAVLDFDPESEASGILAAARSTLEQRRVLHRVVLGDRPTIQPQGTHWFFARGLAGRDSTIELGDFKAWLKKYKKGISTFLESLRAAIDPAPVTVIALWQDPALRNWLGGTLHELTGAFGDLAEIVIASPSAPALQPVAEQYAASCHCLNIRSVCAGISAVMGSRSAQGPAAPRQVPMREGAPWQLSTKDDLWLSEELEVVDLGAGLSGDSSLDAFRRGVEISWRDLQLGSDCQRDLTDSVRRRVERDLQLRTATRVNIYHLPGAGGTTIARRIAWDLHTRFPVAALRRCSIRETCDRLAKLATLTENSIMLLVDGGQHSEREIDDLYDYLRSQNVPCVIVQVLRRFQRPQRTDISWLPAELTPAELDRFLHAYRQIRPNRATDISKLAGGQLNAPRTAFFFGLVAFGRDFQGLDRYVRTRIDGLSSTQQQILGFLSLAYHYGQQSLSAQTFAPLLSLPRSRSVDLVAALTPPIEAGTVVGDLVFSHGENDWRPIHSTIAEALVERIIGGQLPPDLWKQNLSSWATNFAEFIRGLDPIPGDSMKELACRVFIYRDNIELLGTERAAQKEFSQLIDDIPEAAGRISVLRRLAELFDGEAHFHAHLGRFLGQEGNFKDARASIERAIELQPEDAVLHHMRGMVFRYEAVEQMGAREPIEAVVATARQAAESFQESREHRPDNEHGYISEVQLLIRVLDYAERQGAGAFTSGDPFLRDSIGRAEDLLDQVRTLRVGERLSRYEEECRGRLNLLYGDHSKALQIFDNLLSRPDVSKPGVRRQIVWTLLRRRGDVWSTVPKKEVERSSRLLEENLTENSADASSLRLWLRTVRQLESPPYLERVIERVAYWRARGGGLDAAFYLYVLNTLLAMEGSRQALADADRAQEECKAIAKYRRDRTLSFEWLGLGNGVAQLVHQSELGAWAGDFWEGRSKLRRVSARIAVIDLPQRGYIELGGAVKAFFVPAIGGFARGRDENRQVTCFVGFSYDGVRAWEVRPE